MLRGAMKCDKAGETITVKWNGTTIGFSDIPQGSGMEVKVTIDQSKTPITIKRLQTESKRRYARFFYLPEQSPGEHIAVLRVKQLPEGMSFYAGQILVVGTACHEHNRHYRQHRPHQGLGNVPIGGELPPGESVDDFHMESVVCRESLGGCSSTTSEERRKGTLYLRCSGRCGNHQGFAVLPLIVRFRTLTVWLAASQLRALGVARKACWAKLFSIQTSGHLVALPFDSQVVPLPLFNRSLDLGNRVRRFHRIFRYAHARRVDDHPADMLV